MISNPRALVDHFLAVLSSPAAERVRIRDARFGRFAVRVNFHGFLAPACYGGALVPVSQALPPALTIHVIDGAACAVPRPRLAWQLSDFGQKRVVPGWSDDDRTVYLLRGEGGLAVTDWQTRQAFVWLPSSDAAPWYERAAPFRWLFDGLAARLRMSTLHAAAVGIGGEGVLLVGRGGAGKSTLALACLGNGFDYAGDDYCLITQDDGPKAHTLYSTAKWKKDATVTPDWLNTIAPDAIDVTEQKNIVFIDKARPDCLVDSLSIRAIIVPSIGAHAATQLEEISPRTALPHLTASTVAQSEASGSVLLEQLGRLVRSAPAYRLLMTRNPLESVAAIERLLGRKASARGFAP